MHASQTADRRISSHHTVMDPRLFFSLLLHRIRRSSGFASTARQTADASTAPTPSRQRQVPNPNPTYRESPPLLAGTVGRLAWIGQDA
jgi:hypothetical protein